MTLSQRIRQQAEDYERADYAWVAEVEQLEQENERLTDELLRCRKLAHSYIEAYEGLAFGDEHDTFPSEPE